MSYEVVDSTELDTFHRKIAERGRRCDDCDRKAKYIRTVGLWEGGVVKRLTQQLCGIHRRSRSVLPWWFTWGSPPLEVRQLIQEQFTDFQPLEEPIGPGLRGER